MTDQSCHPVVMEALATHRNQFFRWDKNKLLIELKSKANASNFFMIFMIFGKSREFFWCCKYHAQTFVGVTICNHALKLKGHFFILTIAVICVKVFEYFFRTVFENEGLPFYWVELKTFLSMACMFLSACKESRVW